jgi:hypothetical protein
VLITIYSIDGMHPAFTETGENGSIQPQLITPPTREPGVLQTKLQPGTDLTCARLGLGCASTALTMNVMDYERYGLKATSSQLADLQSEDTP